MIDKQVLNLRLDRRLMHRRGWISAQEMDEALTALPDVAEKGELVTDDEVPQPEEAAPEAPPPPPDPFGSQ